MNQTPPGPAVAAISSAELSPAAIRCADSTEFVIKLVVGPDWTRGAGRLVFDFSTMLGTSCPTRYVNEASGYVEIYCSNPLVEYSIHCWDLDLGDYARRDRPPSREAQRMVVVDLSAGLRESDTLELHWGETLGGFGPGAKVSSVVPRPESYGSITVRYFDDHDHGIPDFGFSWHGNSRPEPLQSIDLRYRILPRDAARMRLFRKHDCALLVPYDLFWNVADVANPTTLVTGPAPEGRNAQGVFRYRDRHVQLRSKGLPITQTPVFDSVHRGLNIYWGDLHTHSKYSIDCIQRARMDMTPAELMAFARDRQGLDFFAVSDHHQPCFDAKYHLGKSAWDQTMADVRAMHAPGEFVVFPAFEYRAVRGDTVVVCNWDVAYEDIQQPEWTDVRKLWADWKTRDFITIPHFHSPGRLPDGQWFANARPEHEPVLEIFSDHGSYERARPLENGRALCKIFRQDRCGVHFLKRGYRYGFAANSDDHKGHVGVNGVTAVYSESLERDAILSAYRKRHVYGTSNARIRLLFTANGRLMGSVLPNDNVKVLRIDVTGENTLKRIDLFRNGDLYRVLIPEGLSFSREIKVEEPEADNWYVRVTQHDNHVAWSSPIWFE